MSNEIVLLTALPNGVARNILSEWLELKCVAHVDSAFTNGDLRPQFLDLVSSAVFPVGNGSSIIFTSDFVSWLIARSVKVDRLDLSKVHVKSAQALLDLNGMHLSLVQLTKTDLLPLVATECNKLLRMEYCGNKVNPSKLYDVLSANPTIEYLELSCLSTPDKKKPSFVDAHCPSLRTLSVVLKQSSLHINKFYEQFEKFVVPFLVSIVEHSDRLRAFAFRSPYAILSDAYTPVLSKCANLRTLELFGTSFREGSMAAIATMCPHVVHLDISRSQVSDTDIRYLAEHLALRTVYLDGCLGLTSASLSALLQHSYTTLTALSIVDTFLANSTYMRVTMSLCAILTSCKDLTTLGLNAYHMRDGYMQHLTKLRVCDAAITSDAVRLVARNCQSLQCLSIDETTSNHVCFIDDAAIQELFNKCANLHTLVVSNNNVLYPPFRRMVDGIGYRAPRIQLSSDVSDMKMAVLDFPV